MATSACTSISRRPPRATSPRGARQVHEQHALERRIGHRFRDAALLEQALTHSSSGAQHNERLEFLGDGVLNCVVTEELFERFPGLAEGELTRLRASLVREAALEGLAREIGLPELLRLGKSEMISGGAQRASILADALEAVIGAVFLDAGYDAARAAVRSVFGELLAKADPRLPGKDAKTRLQETLQAQRRELPEYRVLSVQGAAHRKVFEVECLARALGLSATGSGVSRQRAEQQAADNLLKLLPP